MLLPVIKISQEYCNELIIKDITPPYSPQYVGGYGGLNVNVEQITQTKVKISFGKTQNFEYVTPYNQTKDDIIISSYDFTINPIAEKDECGNCGPTYPVCVDDENRMKQFPSGCLDIIYQVFSDDNTIQGGKKLEGTKYVKFVSTCEQDKKLIELMDKITIPNPDGYYDMKREKRKELMQNFQFSWQWLKLMEIEDGCDCDCIAARIQKLESYLKSVQL